MNTITEIDLISLIETDLERSQCTNPGRSVTHRKLTETDDKTTAALLNDKKRH